MDMCLDSDKLCSYILLGIKLNILFLFLLLVWVSIAIQTRRYENLSAKKNCAQLENMFTYFLC